MSNIIDLGMKTVCTNAHRFAFVFSALQMQSLKQQRLQAHCTVLILFLWNGSPHYKKSNDPYNAKNYSDEEDFYDDFSDYYEALDYYNEHH